MDIQPTIPRNRDDRVATATGNAVAAFYNSPFVLPPFRRNEIMIEVQ